MLYLFSFQPVITYLNGVQVCKISPVAAYCNCWSNIYLFSNFTFSAVTFNTKNDCVNTLKIDKAKETQCT